MTQIISDEKINTYIKTMGSAKVNDICSRFNISESTARRTLARLDHSGSIQRYKGGAIAVFSNEKHYDKRVHDSHLEKDLIAREAVKHIKNDSSVILLGRTTLGALCPYIYNMRLTVITNSLTVVDQLKSSQSINLIMLGGIYDREEYEFTGNVTLMGLSIMHADYLFMGCYGISPEVGFTTNKIDMVAFYQLCMKNSDKSFVLADSSKIKRKGIAKFASSGEVDCIITDENMPKNCAEAFTGAGVNVIIAK